MITKEIIVSFFEGKCDARDAAIVQEWFNENPAKLKEYIGEEEWESFQPANVLSPDMSGKLWADIHKNTTSSAAHYLYFRWVAAAASVVLVAALSWLYISQRQKASSVSAATVAITKNISNNTLSKKTLKLNDGSTVDLSPNSTISYPENFNSLKRAVILNGEATFNIAKDVAKPFFRI